MPSDDPHFLATIDEVYLPSIHKSLPLSLSLLKGFLRCLPVSLKSQLFSYLALFSKRRGWEIVPHVYHLPFGLLLKQTRDLRNIEGCALKFLSTIRGVNSPILIDAITTTKKSFILTNYIDGDHCGSVCDQFTTADKERFVADFREQFAALHAQTLSYDRPICNAAGSIIDDPRFSWVAEDELDIQSTREFFQQVWLGLDIPRNRDTIRLDIEPVIELRVPIVFCHGDFVERNIILPGGIDAWRSGRTRACLVDWEFAGWMPQPWDALKATITEGAPDNEWVRMIKTIFPHAGLYLDADWLWRSKANMMLI